MFQRCEINAEMNVRVEKGTKQRILYGLFDSVSSNIPDKSIRKKKK